MPRGEKTRYISGQKNQQKLKKDNYLEKDDFPQNEKQFRTLSTANQKTKSSNTKQNQNTSAKPRQFGNKKSFSKPFKKAA